MTDHEPDRYSNRDTLIGVALALLIATGLWLAAGAACFATLDVLARMGL